MNVFGLGQLFLESVPAILVFLGDGEQAVADGDFNHECLAVEAFFFGGFRHDCGKLLGLEDDAIFLECFGIFLECGMDAFNFFADCADFDINGFQIRLKFFKLCLADVFFAKESVDKSLFGLGEVIDLQVISIFLSWKAMVLVKYSAWARSFCS